MSLDLIFFYSGEEMGPGTRASTVLPEDAMEQLAPPCITLFGSTCYVHVVTENFAVCVGTTDH